MYVAYFDRISGAVRTQKLVQTFLAILNLRQSRDCKQELTRVQVSTSFNTETKVLFFRSFFLFSDEKSPRPSNTNKKGWKHQKKFNSFQAHAAPESWSKYTTYVSLFWAFFLQILHLLLSMHCFFRFVLLGQICASGLVSSVLV